MKLKCPFCESAITIEVKSSVNEYPCPNCSKMIDITRAQTILYEEAPKMGDELQLPELNPGDRFGQYKIIELVGKGGMGAVYKALQESLDRFVAIKFLPKDLAKDHAFVDRFNREAKLLATLSHPNIVSIFDKGVERDFYYFVMEYVDGVNLRKIISEQKLTPEEALNIVPYLCNALEYAHQQGVVHRDIKPENILIDKQGRVKITDFGIAKIVKGEVPSQTVTKSGDVIGTIEYMAPEQRESARKVDSRADIYSLGVIIYEMLTGELPIGRFEPPSKKVQVDVRLDEIVLRSLEKNPERRYQRASDIATDIKRVTESESTEKPEESPGEKSKEESEEYVHIGPDGIHVEGKGKKVKVDLEALGVDLKGIMNTVKESIKKGVEDKGEKVVRIGPDGIHIKKKGKEIKIEGGWLGHNIAKVVKDALSNIASEKISHYARSSWSTAFAGLIWALLFICGVLGTYSPYTHKWAMWGAVIAGAFAVSSGLKALRKIAKDENLYGSGVAIFGTLLGASLPLVLLILFYTKEFNPVYFRTVIENYLLLFGHIFAFYLLFIDCIARDIKQFGTIFGKDIRNDRIWAYLLVINLFIGWALFAYFAEKYLIFTSFVVALVYFYVVVRVFPRKVVTESEEK